jgi:hypothetical protein
MALVSNHIAHSLLEAIQEILGLVPHLGEAWQVRVVHVVLEHWCQQVLLNASLQCASESSFIRCNTRLMRLSLTLSLSPAHVMQWYILKCVNCVMVSLRNMQILRHPPLVFGKRLATQPFRPHQISISNDSRPNGPCRNASPLSQVKYRPLRSFNQLCSSIRS